MLGKLRKSAQSWFAKALLILLVLSFFLWGIGDYIVPQQDVNWAAKVGDTVISRDEFSQEYRRTLNRFGAAFGNAIDPRQAQALGLPQTVLQQMIDGALLDAGAADLGLRISDQAAKAAIEADPTFHDADGRFDVFRFRQILAQNGLSEQSYVATVRQSMRRNQLSNAVSAGVGLPNDIIDGVYGYRNQTRTARYVHIADAGSEDRLPTPDEPGLRAFHTENPGLFTAPEYRSITAIILTADDLIDRIQVSEAALQDLYAERLGELSVPERRTVLQFTTGDEALARDAASRITAGEDFAAVGEALTGLPAADLSFDAVTPDQLLPELADAVFSAPLDTIVGPLQSPLGWHLATVIEILPGEEPSLEDVRPDLERELAQEEAIDALIRLTEELQDTLAGGAALESAAAQLDLPVRTVAAVDPGGLDRDGEPVLDLPARFVETALDTSEGAESQLIETDTETFFILRVDQVTPAALNPFETVRDQVEQAWRSHEKRKISENTAESIAAKIDGGTPLTDLAEAEGLTVSTTEPLTRATRAEGLPLEFVDRLFETPVGKALQLPDGLGVIVAETVTIDDADLSGNADARVQLRDQLDADARQDALGQLADALRGHYTVEINPQVFDYVF